MLTEMRTFVLLAEEGSIQKVAERLPLTQPAVTRQIQRLEQTLGVDLLDRRQKPPALTPTGLEVLARSRRILAEFEDMRQIAKGREPEGLLRIGIANGLADHRFASIFADVGARFPRVSLRLAAGWSSELSERLHRGLLDAAVLLSGEAASAEAVTIGSERLAVIASSEAPSMRLRAENLGRQPWILSPEPCDARRRLAAALAGLGLPMRIAAEVQDARLQLALVREGVGMGLMPSRLLADEPPPGIAVVEAPQFDLTLDMRVQRSPYLHALAEVVDRITDGLRMPEPPRPDGQR